MSTSRQIPGGAYVVETSRNARQIPGGPYLIERKPVATSNLPVLVHSHRQQGVM